MKRKIFNVERELNRLMNVKEAEDPFLHLVSMIEEILNDGKIIFLKKFQNFERPSTNSFEEDHLWQYISSVRGIISGGDEWSKDLILQHLFAICKEPASNPLLGKTLLDLMIPGFCRLGLSRLTPFNKVVVDLGKMCEKEVKKFQLREEKLDYFINLPYLLRKGLSEKAKRRKRGKEFQRNRNVYLLWSELLSKAQFIDVKGERLPLDNLNVTYKIRCKQCGREVCITAIGPFSAVNVVTSEMPVYDKGVYDFWNHYQCYHPLDEGLQCPQDFEVKIS